MSMFTAMKNQAARLAAAAVLLSLLAGCSTAPSRSITQVATIDALLTGVYDGHMSLEKLHTYGNFGIGTFEALDGEMVLLNGKFYKIRANGEVYQPALTERTPFACVTTFSPDVRADISEATDMKGLEARIDALAPEPNKFVAFALHGTFKQIKTRSVPAQKKPYPPLAEVTKTQPVFSLLKVTGTLVGFRAPSFVKGVNVPGYHIHFLADGLTGGGHVLEFDLLKGALEADTTHDWMNIYLPAGNQDFNTADLAKDRSRELQSAERNPAPAISGSTGIKRD